MSKKIPIIIDMGEKYKQYPADKIKFSIGAKLITIISILIIISMGSVAALGFYLVHEDTLASAKERNLEANRRSAMEAETAIGNVLSNSRILLQTITAGQGRASAGESADLFFRENPQTAVLFYFAPRETERLFINKNFFVSHNINENRVASFFESQRNALGRAIRGETVLTNASSRFSSPLLALFFPWQNGGVGGVIFSSEDLNSNFGFGANKSYMINSDGDILLHPVFSFVRSDLNIGNEDFIRSIQGRVSRSGQALIEVDYDFLRISEKSVEAGFPHNLTDIVKQKAQSAAEAFFVLQTIAKEKIFSLLDRAEDNVHAEIVSLKPADEKKIRQFTAFTKLKVAGVTVITVIEYDKVFAGITYAMKLNILIALAVFIISLILISRFSKTISRPLKTLALETHKMENGVFETSLKAGGSDEIGALTSGFQKMSSALRVFSRFADREIAVKTMRGEIQPGGFSKHATILFSDIRGFASESENFRKTFGNDAPDKIVQWLNNYFSRIIDCVGKTNGTVDKFIGDAVMAHWGAAYTAGTPRRDAFNCIKAALIMRKELYFLNKELAAGDTANPYIMVGCGINSGVVTAGQFGNDSRMEYTIIGAPVNFTFNIEALTKQYGADILISEDTWRLIGDLFVTEEMPSITVKGREKPVRVFAVVNFTGEEKGPQDMDEVRALLGIDVSDLSLLDAAV